MSAPCQSPVPFETLLAYHLRELPELEAEQVEEHYFGCGYCSRRLEVLTLFERGFGDLAQNGQLFVSGTLSMVGHARARGIAVREYRTDPGEHVHCTASPSDDLLVTRYGGLGAFSSVDVHFRGTIVGTDQLIEMAFSDSPVDQETGDVVLLAPAALNRSLPPLDIEIVIHAKSAAGAHEAGRYYYHHRPWDMLDDDERQRRAGR